MNVLATEIEITIFEPDFLGIFLLAEDRHRQLGSFGLHGDARSANFNLARWEVRIHRFLGTSDYLAFDGNNGFDANLVERPERRRIRIGDNLRDSIVVAEIDED